MKQEDLSFEEQEMIMKARKMKKEDAERLIKKHKASLFNNCLFDSKDQLSPTLRKRLEILEGDYHLAILARNQKSISDVQFNAILRRKDKLAKDITREIKKQDLIDAGDYHGQVVSLTQAEIAMAGLAHLKFATRKKFDTPLELAKRADEYFEFVEQRRVRNEKKNETRAQNMPYVKDDPMTMEDFICFIGMAKSTYYEYEKRPGFKEVCETVKNKIISGVLSGSLKGEYNSNIASLYLTNISEFKDVSTVEQKKEIDHTIQIVSVNNQRDLQKVQKIMNIEEKNEDLSLFEKTAPVLISAGNSIEAEILNEDD